jgi:hypothetical protein
MADYCPTCFEVIDGFHICDDAPQGKRNSSFTGAGSGSSNLEKVVLAAPFGGLVLDLFLPLPSSVLHSILVSFLGCICVGILWVTFAFNGKKSFNFYLRNIKNFAFTPNMIKIFGNGSQKNAVRGWLLALAFSSVLQILIFTPGNASYLGHQVTNKIDKASGANLEVSCPSTKIYLYNEKIECRVKTGLLGITVPARAKLSPIVGSAEIKVSLF